MVYLEISGEHVNECDECHNEALGIWYEDMDTGVEWFVCNACRARDEARGKCRYGDGSELEF